MEPTSRPPSPSYDGGFEPVGDYQDDDYMDFYSAVGTAPLPQISDNQKERICSAVKSKFPGIAANVVGTVISLVATYMTPVSPARNDEMDSFNQEMRKGNILAGFDMVIGLVILVSAIKMFRDPNPKKEVTAFINFQIGNILGSIGKLVGTLMCGRPEGFPLFLGTIMLSAFNTFTIAGASVHKLIFDKGVAPETFSKKTNDTIKRAIEEGLLDKDGVETFTSLQAMQNLLIFDSLSELKASQFKNLFSRLINNNTVLLDGKPIDMATITKIKKKLDSLSKNDIEILKRSLAGTQTPIEEMEKPKTIQKTFNLITGMSFYVWNQYKDEITAVVMKEQKVELEEFDNFYTKFLEFMKTSPILF